MRSVHTLLHGIVDYAGLFPPAGLGMDAAVRRFAEYRSADTSWALGRFVVPAARLAGFEAAARPHLQTGGAPWQLSALLGPDLEANLAVIRAFNDRLAGSAVVDAVELKAQSGGAIAQAIETIGGRLDVYVELPITEDPGPLIATLARLGGRAKVRTGGVTADAFPAAADLLRFIRRCAEARVPFKATAGLHHPLRASYRLTYASDSPSAPMYGFLNLFLTAALVNQGAADAAALALLTETLPGEFRFENEAVAWREHRLTEAELRRTRDQLAIAFGSCSFQEPIDDLRALSLL